MKLFHWPLAKSNKLYSSGDIIVAANTIEEARATALHHARHKVEHLGYTDMAYRRTSNDDDDQKEFREKIEEVERDLNVEPKVYELPAAIFINGGE